MGKKIITTKIKTNIRLAFMFIFFSNFSSLFFFLFWVNNQTTLVLLIQKLNAGKQ
jgi:hypothetical protein